MKQLHLKTEDKGPEDSIIVNLKGALLNNANTTKKQSIIKKKKKRKILLQEKLVTICPPRWQWPFSLIWGLKKGILRRDNRQ